MKAWTFKRDITRFIPSTLLFPYFLELIRSCSASILLQYSLAYLELCQTSKMESFAKTVMTKNSIALEILWFFDDFREGVSGV